MCGSKITSSNLAFCAHLNENSVLETLMAFEIS